MPVVGSLANASARGLGWGLFASEGNAFELVKPSSVVVTGGGSETATISALGSVEFSAATSLSLNDVFSSGYDNYMIVIRHLHTANKVTRFRLRSSGTDNSTASSYVYQSLQASSTTVSGGRTTTNFALVGVGDSTQRSGDSIYIYGPALAQPTAIRNISVSGENSARIYDYASTHNQSTAYDGFTIYFDAGTFAGRIAVYGMRG